jgi:hypothetical protein
LLLFGNNMTKTATVLYLIYFNIKMSWWIKIVV